MNSERQTYCVKNVNKKIDSMHTSNTDRQSMCHLFIQVIQIDQLKWNVQFNIRYFKNISPFSSSHVPIIHVHRNEMTKTFILQTLNLCRKRIASRNVRSDQAQLNQPFAVILDECELFELSINFCFYWNNGCVWFSFYEFFNSIHNNALCSLFLCVCVYFMLYHI